VTKHGSRNADNYLDFSIKVLLIPNEECLIQPYTTQKQSEENCESGIKVNSAGSLRQLAF
jgi:hypothetical protein